MTGILRYTAFSGDPSGGNPAGVVLDARGMSDAEMLATAAAVGYSETIFVTGDAPDGALAVRYFSPRAEVDFCGHVTIALGVAHAERNGPGTLRLRTKAGPITVTTAVPPSGPPTAALTSVATRTRPATEAQVAAALAALRWPAADLDPSLPAHVAYAGNDHLVLAAASRARLAGLDYDFAALDAVMAAHAWTTLQLVWRESPEVFHARDPFPPGGVVEDAATGAAAAAFGGYLRDLGLFPASGAVTVRQGADMGRPSLLTVTLADGGRVRVGGTAVPIA